MCNGYRYEGKRDCNKLHIRNNSQNGKPVEVMFYYAVRHATDELGLKSGDNIVLTGGRASMQSGSTNTIRLETVK